MKRSTTKTTIDPLPIVRELVRKQKYRVKQHAVGRQKERAVSLKDILYVLKNGCHEKEKDSFDVRRQTWKYAIRGKTQDGVDLRIIVALAEGLLAIITVITPAKGKL